MTLSFSSLHEGNMTYGDPVPTTVGGLIDKGVMRLPIGNHLFEMAKEAAGMHRAFLNEPTDFLEPWTELEPQGRIGDPETGHLPRHGQKEHDGLGHYDHKDNFHYRPSLWRLLEGVAEFNPYREWLVLMDEILRESVGILQDVASNLDIRLDNTRLRAQIRESWDENLHARQRHVFRLVRYHPQTQAMLGQEHPDRALLTLHLAESHAGLEGEIDGDFMPLTVRPGSALVFFGEKAPLVTNGRLQPFVHRVVNNTPDLERWAAITFAHVPTLIPHREEQLAKAPA